MATSHSRGGEEPAPQINLPNWDRFPVALSRLPRWLLWKYELIDGRWTKVPKRTDGITNASSTSADTWTTFDRVRKALSKTTDCGAGFVFNDDGVTGIDLDDAVHINGTCTLKPWAKEIVEKFKGSYMEWSPSHTGIHIICRGRLQANGAVAVVTAGGNIVGKLERYAHKRYFTMTGDTL